MWTDNWWYYVGVLVVYFIMAPFVQSNAQHSVEIKKTQEAKGKRRACGFDSFKDQRRRLIYERP